MHTKDINVLHNESVRVIFYRVFSSDTERLFFFCENENRHAYQFKYSKFWASKYLSLRNNNNNR